MKLRHTPLNIGDWYEVEVVTNEGQRVRYLERAIGPNTVERIDPAGNVYNSYGGGTGKRGLGPLDKPQFPFPTWDESKQGLPKVYPNPRPGPYHPPVNDGRLAQLPPKRIGLGAPVDKVRQGRAW